MSDGLDQIERLARLCLARVSRAEKRKLLATLARDLRTAQATRIAAQRQPDGGPFAPRRPRRPDPPGAYSIRFLYPQGDPNPHAVLLRSWVHQGDVFTGLDVATGALRSYRWDKVVRFLPAAADQRAPGPRLPQRGKIRARAMFRKLRTARYLRVGVESDEAWAGWGGAAATIARIHHQGLSDRPTPGAKPVRYARRMLLGLSEPERRALTDQLLQALTNFLPA
ncbi:phage virion morphogenesis protein [Sphingomonas phyllosphaerae]|uniref:phage virion morphogenesis protein n=1 Tax=Sphingomonas phyllosphaerae TaxID=257003 RepID=UPI00241322C8|nr:phage virion morphogenesis protein [Sphingomonas phyllosphaerae]